MDDLNIQGIARQQWRARIETSAVGAGYEQQARIARQQWRARIETGAARLTAWPATLHRPPAMAGAD